MLAQFCLRLALGLMLVLPLIWNCLPQPRFVRTQSLTAVGLLVVAGVSSWGDARTWLHACLVAAILVMVLGAVTWTLETAPGGRSLVVIAGVLLAGSVILGSAGNSESGSWGHFLSVGDFTSAALLGAAFTAMLVGHSYLSAPGFSIRPLMIILVALFSAIGARALVAGTSFWVATVFEGPLSGESCLWLPVRWLVGIVAPAIFGWMAYSSAKIRSTQSATGILYVVVVCTFVGELLGMILARQTGLPL